MINYFYEPKLRFWCQKVLPLVYDDSLSYYEVLCKVVKYVNSLAEDISKIPNYVLEAISGLTDASVDTADMLVDTDPEAGSYISTRGFHAVGDLGACLYKITDDYNEVATAKSYLVLAGTNKWAIPVMTKAYVTPEMFGAYGDGETDDGDALKTAIEKYKNVKCVNSYAVETHTLEIANADNINISGGGSIVFCDMEFTGCDNLTIKNINFPNSNRPITIESCDNVVIDSCNLESNPTFGAARLVTIFGGKNITVCNCSGTNVQYGVICRPYQTEVAKNVVVKNCYFANSRGLSYPAAINVAEADGVVCDSNYITGITGADGHTGYAIYTGDQEYNDPKNVVISNNTIDNCDQGIAFHCIDNAKVTGNTVTNVAVAVNTFGDASTATEKDTTNNIIICNNYFERHVSLGGKVKGVLIANNHFVSNGTNPSQYGVHATNAANAIPEDIVIDGNYFNKIVRASIYLQFANNVIVKNNIIIDSNDGGDASAYYRGAITIYNVDDVEVFGNKITGKTFGIVKHNANTVAIIHDNFVDTVGAGYVGGYRALPTAGKWTAQRVGYYQEPGTQGYIGFVCTSAGDFDSATPIFVNFGAVAST